MISQNMNFILHKIKEILLGPTWHFRREDGLLLVSVHIANDFPSCMTIKSTLHPIPRNHHDS